MFLLEAREAVSAGGLNSLVDEFLADFADQRPVGKAGVEHFPAFSAVSGLAGQRQPYAFARGFVRPITVAAQ